MLPPGSKQVHAEPALVIQPLPLQAEGRFPREVVDFVQRVLVGVLGVDRLTARERDLDARDIDPDALRPRADQVHLDAPEFLVVGRLVSNAARSNSPPSSRFMRSSRLRLNAAVIPCA